MKPSTHAGEDLGETFRSYGAELVRLAAFILGDRGAAEDVVQDVFARVHQRGRPMDGDALPYLRAAVVNGCRSTIRRRLLIRRHDEKDSPCPPLTATPGGLSWTADGRTLVIDEYWQAPWVTEPDLAVFGLNTASGGGSLQASSRLLLHQDYNCVTCVSEALAGPGDSLTAVEGTPAGKQDARLRVVRIPLAAEGSQSVLYSTLYSGTVSTNPLAIVTDSSGQWVIVWPVDDSSTPGFEGLWAGWISGGKVHSLGGGTSLLLYYPIPIAW